MESPLLTKDEIGNNPKQGVYVFYDEEEKPIYVGRSNNIRQRIRQHGADSSMNESATFAFELLQEDQMDEPDIPGRRSPGVTRKQLQNKYPEKFAAKRKRVRDMKIQVVEITDQPLQYVFEAYAILTLGTTRYNKFWTT